ncbi:MAG: alpha/beta hydrolase [Pseudomonadota bacterium]
MQSFLIIGILSYVTLAAALFLMQRGMLYGPSNAAPDPSVVGLKDVTVTPIETPDGETILLWHTPLLAGQPTVLFLHGNGGEIANRANRFAAYQSAGFNAVFVSYRGYGGSSGSPTENGLITDALSAYDWVRSQGVAPRTIALVGESLGTGVAVQLAAKREVGALLLGAPFSAAVDVAAKRFPWLPVRILMKDQFRSRDYIGDVSVPILIQHCTEDRVVPYEFGRALDEAAGENAQFVSVPGAGHQMLYGPEILQREISFIQSALPP